MHASVQTELLRQESQERRASQLNSLEMPKAKCLFKVRLSLGSSGQTQEGEPRCVLGRERGGSHRHVTYRTYMGLLSRSGLWLLWLCDGQATGDRNSPGRPGSWASTEWSLMSASGRPPPSCAAGCHRASHQHAPISASLSVLITSSPGPPISPSLHLSTSYFSCLLSVNPLLFAPT